MRKTIVQGLCLFVVTLHATAQDWKMQPVPVRTRWAKEVSPENALPEYPRPQLVRNNWKNLNGLWEYAITEKNAATPLDFNGKILVPYPLESALSGVKKPLYPNQLLWYKRSFEAQNTNGKTMLHFGAVDYRCRVYVNRKEMGYHEGGYTEFALDISEAVNAGTNELLVKVEDPTNAGVGPHGKQVLNPANIYYTPTSGIWQTVWLETVPHTYISSLTITPDLDAGRVHITVNATANASVELVVDGKTVEGKANNKVSIPLASPHPWSPGDPFLYDLKVKMGKDEITSYFGMRKISIGKDDQGFDRIMLNNKPYFNLATLDQGFWPDGLYTAPTDEALAFDIRAIKAMGFNTIRKHIKVEPARWYYWADKLGMLVWQDFVNPNQGLPEGAKPAFEHGAAETMKQLHNYPSVVVYTIFNEKWGQYDQQRITEWVKKTEPTRVINGHSGEYLYVNNKLRSPSPNAYVSADLTDVHSYPEPRDAIKMEGKAQVVGEFGGIGTFIPDHQWVTGSAWGYVQEKAATLQEKYMIMNQRLQLLQKEGLSASVYTQPFDVEGEQNGLMTYDREVIKIPFDTLRKIHAPLNPDTSNTSPVRATDADLAHPGLTYRRLLQEHINRNREPAFLKKLALIASQAGDREGAETAVNDVVAGMKASYKLKNNLEKKKNLSRNR